MRGGKLGDRGVRWTGSYENSGVICFWEVPQWMEVASRMNFWKLFGSRRQAWFLEWTLAGRGCDVPTYPLPLTKSNDTPDISFLVHPPELQHRSAPVLDVN